MKHTPEPWKVGNDTHNFIDDIRGYVGGCSLPEDVKRVIACVNACAGINPEALQEFIAAAKKLREKPITGDVRRFDLALHALTPQPATADGERFA